MKFVGQGCQELQHKQYRQTDRQRGRHDWMYCHVTFVDAKKSNSNTLVIHCPTLFAIFRWWRFGPCWHWRTCEWRCRCDPAFDLWPTSWPTCGACERIQCVHGRAADCCWWPEDGAQVWWTCQIIESHITALEPMSSECLFVCWSFVLTWLVVRISLLTSNWMVSSLLYLLT